MDIVTFLTKLSQLNVWIKSFLDNCRSPKENHDVEVSSTSEIDDIEIHLIKTM